MLNGRPATSIKHQRVAQINLKFQTGRILSVAGTQFFVSIRKQIWFCGNDFWRFFIQLKPILSHEVSETSPFRSAASFKNSITYFFCWIIEVFQFVIVHSIYFHSILHGHKKHRGNSVTAFSRILKQFPGILLNCRNELTFNLTPAQQ